MEFTSTKNNLLSSLHRVSGLTQGKSTHLPILNNILISAKKGGITLTSTNLEIGITTILRGKVQTEGEFTIPVRMFLDFVQTLPEDNVTCTLKEKHVLKLVVVYLNFKEKSLFLLEQIVLDSQKRS